MFVAYNTANTFISRIRKKTVARNFTSLTFGSVVSQAFNLLAIIKLAKILSPSNYGLFTFLTVQGQLLISIGDLGITNILIRTVARNKETSKDFVYNGLLMKLIAVAILSVIYFIYNHYAGSLTFYETLLVCSFPVITCAANLFENTFWGHESMLPPSVISVLFSVVWYAIVLILPANQITVTSVFLIFLSLNFIKGLALYLTLKARNLIQGERSPFFASSRNILRESWPYFSIVLLCLPYNYLSNNFLDINSTTQEIGYYNLAQKLVSPVSLVIGFALSALFPNLSGLWVRDQEKFFDLVIKGVKLFILVSVLLCFTFTLFAKEVVMLLFSKEYLPAVDVCKLQVWFIFLMGVNSLISTIWGAINKEKNLIKTTIVNFIISVPLLYIGSKYGAVGLAYGYIISFSLFEIYLWRIFRNTLSQKISGDKLIWLVAIILFAVSYLIPESTHFFYKVLIALTVVASLSYFLIKLFQSLLSERNSN